MQIAALEESLQVVGRYPLGKQFDLDLGVYLMGQPLIHFDLGLVHRRSESRRLPVHMWRIECNILSQSETFHAGANKAQECSSTHSAKPSISDQGLRQSGDTLPAKDREASVKKFLHNVLLSRDVDF